MWENAQSLLRGDGAMWVAPGGRWLREQRGLALSVHNEFMALLLYPHYTWQDPCYTWVLDFGNSAWNGYQLGWIVPCLIQKQALCKWGFLKHVFQKAKGRVRCLERKH